MWGWTSPRAGACYAVGGLGLAGFVAWELRRGTAALLPLDLLRRRTFAVPVAVSAVVGAAQFGGMVVVPLYLQIVRGVTPTFAGLMLIPMVAGISATSVVVGHLVRRTGRTKIFPVVGLGVQLVAFAGLATVSAGTALGLVDVWMFLLGVGLGATSNTIMLMLQNAVDFTCFGVAGAAGTFFRNIGATAGTAVLLTVLFHRAGTAMAGAYAAAGSEETFRQAAAAHPDQVATLGEHLTGPLADTSFLAGLDPVLAHPFLQGFTQAMDTVCVLAALLAALGLALALALKETPLRAMSGRASGA